MFQTVLTKHIISEVWMLCQHIFFPLRRFCMVYSEVPNFSEPNPELLNQGNQQNKSVSIHTPTHNFI